MLHPTRNTLPESMRTQSVEHLNRFLAAAIDLHAQLKQAHWNVRGPNFIAIHELFDKVSVQDEDFSYLIAERVGALGGVANGTVQTASAQSFLIKYPLGIDDEQKHIFSVAGALAAFGQAIQEGITKATKMGDATTADVLTEISRGIDKQLWFVESHVERKLSDQRKST
jgi:starvation-inducible DNA-binding protein